MLSIISVSAPDTLVYEISRFNVLGRDGAFVSFVVHSSVLPFSFSRVAGIRQLQLILLKVALLVGIEIHVNVEFKGLIEPPEDQEPESECAQKRWRAGRRRAFPPRHTCRVFSSGIGWRAEVHPRTHPVNELEFNVIIGADGRRNTLPGKSSQCCSFSLNKRKGQYGLFVAYKPTHRTMISSVHRCS